MDGSGPSVTVAPAALKSFCVDVLRRVGVPFEKRASGVERIFLPSEREYLLLEERRVSGIPIGTGVFAELRELGAGYGVALEAVA